MAYPLDDAICFDPMHKSCRHKAGKKDSAAGRLARGLTRD